MAPMVGGARSPFDPPPGRALGGAGAPGARGGLERIEIVDSGRTCSDSGATCPVPRQPNSSDAPSSWI